MCAPGLSVDEYFSTGPDFERPIFEAVRAHVESLGPMHIEPVQVGIFFKNPRRFADLRPMTKWVALSFALDRKIEHRTIKRRPMDYHGRWYHTANLTSAADVDEAVKGWLTESYFAT
jgi:hypothetical protein